MPADELGKVFTRFYQGTASTEGSGVGLNICKRITEDLGGRIRMESPGPGQGTHGRRRAPARLTGALTDAVSAPAEPPGMNRTSWATAAFWLLLLVLLANALGFALQPIRDPDFFWHLKTGEWILEHRALPGEYLFAVAPQKTPPETQRFAMTSYWMAQSLLAALHEAAGFGAIAALRWLLFFALLLLVARRMRGDALVRLGLLSLAVPVLGLYPPERPQYFSFVFTAVLLLLLDGLRGGGSLAAARWRAAAVPPLVALWANCHGGFVVGLGILGYVALAESIKLSHRRFEPLPPERLRILLAAAAGGLLASLLNPNGWQAFRIAMLPSGITEFVREYRSTIEAFRFNVGPWVYAYWLLLALVLVGLALRWRKPDLTAIGFVLLTGYYSFTLVRHIPFFVVIALPIAAAALSDPRVVRVTRVLVAALGLGAGVFFLPDAVHSFQDARRCAGIDESVFPVEAAGFVEAARLQGNMFNQYGWGGYLLWRLAPAKAFIDGRNGDPELVEGYKRLLAGERRLFHGKEFWKILFGKYSIRFTVTGAFDPLSGEVYGLLDALLADPAWVPVFVSRQAVVFAEDVPGNREVLLRSALAKAGFYAALLDSTERLIADMPAYVAPHVARGDLFLRLGDRAAALRSYEAALRLAPFHPVARRRVAGLRGG